MSNYSSQERVYIHAPRARFALHQLRALIDGAATLPRLMYDSTNLFDVPLSAPMVASYDTGYPQSDAAWDRFDGKPQIHIVQHAGVYNEGDVLDVESGAAGLDDVHRFIATRRAAGYFRPTIYCSLDLVPQIRWVTAEFRLGIEYDLWVAHWTGTPHVAYPGSAATQYASKKNYDLSAVYDPRWPHRTAPGPFKHVADGTYSLDSVAAKRHTSAAHLAEVTGRHASDADLAGFAEYLLAGITRDQVAAALAPLTAYDKAAARKMPKGTVWWSSNP